MTRAWQRRRSGACDSWTDGWCGTECTGSIPVIRRPAMTLRFAVIGIDHRHVFELTQHLIDAGMESAGWWPVTTNSHVLAGYRKRFAHLPEVADREQMLEDRS